MSLDPPKKRKLIIDTDGGGDDAIALLIALHAAFERKEVELVAITTCWGNVELDQVNENVAKLLDFYEAPDIPVVVGCRLPILGKRETETWPGHGKDGFGDANFPPSRRKLETNIHASQYIVNACKNLQDDEELQIVTLGPLTNLAAAFILDPTIEKVFRRPPNHPYPALVIMGGAVEGKGNSSMIAEFNIHSDPEAAYIVLNAMREGGRACIISWEVSLTCPMPWVWFDEWVGKRLPEDRRATIQVFIDKVFGAYQRLYREKAKDSDDCVVADAVAVAAALYPKFVVNKLVTHSNIEMSGHFSRGATIVDWYTKMHDKVQNSEIVTKLDTKLFLTVLTSIVTDHPSFFRVKGHAPPSIG